jgi:nitrogenase molybdenum-iron protein beta chain
LTGFIERAKFTCALGGALTTLSALHKVVPIVHASGGCAGTLSNAYNTAGGYKGSGYCGGTMTPTSNIVENDIVFGGEERLEEEISEAVRFMDGDLYFVITGCQVEIIGDNAVEVVRRFKDGPATVLAANTPGFLGNTYAGYDQVMKTIAAELVEPRDRKRPKTVNLLGIVPGQDVFYRGNLRELKRLLGLIGIKANTFFGDGETIDDIRGYGDAALNIVFSECCGVTPAVTFQETHGIPFISTDLPVGAVAAEMFLRNIAQRLDVDRQVLEKALTEEKQVYYSYLERILDIYGDADFQRYAIVSADSYYAFALTRFVADELGWIPHLTVINDLTDENSQRAYADKFTGIDSETKPQIVYEPHAGRLQHHIRKSWPYNRNEKYYNALSPVFLVGSSLESFAAQTIGAGFLSVAFPVTNRVAMSKGYSGFTGGLSLAEDLFSVLVSNR